MQVGGLNNRKLLKK